MGFVRLDQHGYLTDRNGKPFYLVGINFAPRYVRGVFWKENWDPQSILADLDKIRDMGLNGIRFPVHWYAFEPEEGKLDPVMLQRLDWFMAVCRERELYMHPWFLVGMGCGMHDVPWRKGRSVLFDESMICAEEKHLAAFAKRYANEEYIIAWDICDEPEWWTVVIGKDEHPLPYDRRQFAAWTRRMYRAFKDNDPNHMVTMGVGHIATGNYGMDIRDMAETLDIMSITAYTQPNCGEGIDKARPGFFYDWHADMNRFGRSVYLCECPGASSSEHFDEEICGQYESAIFGAWLHGSVGAIPWALQCYPREIWTNGYLDQYMDEQMFSVIKSDGSLKPQGKTLCEVARVLKKIDASQYILPKPRAALLIPEGYHAHVDACYSELRETYAALLAADVPIETVWMSDSYQRYPAVVLGAAYSLLWYGDMRASESLALKEYAENGGCLLNFWNPRKAKGPFFEETYGATPGSNAKIWGERELVFAQDIGDFHAGDSLPLGEKADEYIRLKPTTAKVLASVDGGRPCILYNRVGKGLAILVAIDLLGGLYDISPEQWASSRLFALVAGLMELLGISRPVICDDPNVECGIMESALDDSRLVLLINRNDRPCVQPAFVPGMAGYKPETPDGAAMPYAERNGGLELLAPFAERKATLAILKKSEHKAAF